MSLSKIAMVFCAFACATAQAGWTPKNLSWNAMKELCKDPAQSKLENQISVKEWDVSCQDQVQLWEQRGLEQVEIDAGADIAFDNGVGQITWSASPATGQANKGSMASQSGEGVEVVDSVYMCPVFHKVKYTYKQNYKTSCEEINAHETAKSFCIAKVKEDTSFEYEMYYSKEDMDVAPKYACKLQTKQELFGKGIKTELYEDAADIPEPDAALKRKN